MALYRIIFAPPGAITRRGAVHEMWLEATSPTGAAIRAHDKYPKAIVAEVHRGLSERQRDALVHHLTGYTRRSHIHAALCDASGTRLHVHHSEALVAASGEG